jgi:uncharacterized RDD family membrane protein YckC
MNSPDTNAINDGTRFGGFWLRVGAYFIDVVVLMLPNLLISYLYRSVTATADEIEQLAVEVMNFGISVVVYWVYFAVCHSSVWQASLGKKAVGLKVVDESGGRISFGRATGRYYAEFLSMLIFFIGYMMIGWSKKKQGLHDLIAKTYVIKTDNA